MSEQSTVTPKPQNPEGIGKAFTEACSHHRFFVDLRYKVFQMFALGTFGTSAIYWAIRVGAREEGQRMDLVSNWSIRLAGVAICLFCAILDRRVGQLVARYEKESRFYAGRLGIVLFSKKKAGTEWGKMYSFASRLLYALAAVVWLVVSWW